MPAATAKRKSKAAGLDVENGVGVGKEYSAAPKKMREAGTGSGEKKPVKVSGMRTPFWGIMGGL